MQVTFGNATFEYPSEQLGQLRESNDVLDQPELLGQRMAQDGYLFIRQLIPRQVVLDARATVLQYMADHEGMEPGSRPLDGVMGQYGKSVPLMGQKHITRAPQVLAALESPALFTFYEKLLGQPALTFDYKWMRAVGREQFTGSHYDIVYMGQGSQRLLTCWVPLGDIDIQQGVLAICEGSHNLPGFEKLRATYGRMDVDRDRVAGAFSSNPQEIIDRFGGRWKTANFRAGDILTFGMYTMHASTTNTTDRWRLSCDVRFQPATDAADPRWMGKDPLAHHAWHSEPEKLKPMAQARSEWGV